MRYTFSVSSYDDPALEDEIALALDARSSLSFRKRGAAPSPPHAPKQESPSKRKALKLAAIVLLGLGAAALLCVMTLPQRPKPLQIAGFALLGLGMILMPPGKPGQAHVTGKSRQKAQRLLTVLRQNSFMSGLNVTFDGEKMDIATKSKTIEVPYEQIFSVIETEHIWFVSYGQAGVVLQKRDLTEGEPRDFLKHIAQQAGCSTEIVYWQEQKTQTTDEPSDAQTTGEAL